MCARFFPRFVQVKGDFCLNWFIALFVPVVSDWSNYFGIGFFDNHLKTTPNKLFYLHEIIRHASWSVIHVPTHSSGTQSTLF